MSTQRGTVVLAMLIALGSTIVACRSACSARTSPLLPSTSSDPFDSVYWDSAPYAGPARYSVINAATGRSERQRPDAGIYPVSQVAFDSDGTLYQLPCNYGSGCIGVYPLGRKEPIVNLEVPFSGEPFSGPSVIAVRDGTLYVANPDEPAGGNVIEYGSRGNKILRTLSTGIRNPVSLAVGRGGDLYVANADSHAVTVYAPGSSELVRTVSLGKAQPFEVLLDGAETLYVVCTNGSVYEFDGGREPLSRTVVYGRSYDVTAGGVSRGGILYVGLAAGDEGYGHVDQFLRGRVQRSHTINLQFGDPYMLLADDIGDLYVAVRAESDDDADHVPRSGV